MDQHNIDQPKPFIMWIISLFTMLMAAVTYISSSGEGWSILNIMTQLAISTLAVGLLVTAVSPSRGWWGIRLSAFVIFGSYFWYIIDQFIIQGGVFEPTLDRSSKSPFNALLGFLIIGTPCLMFSLWGSVKGKFGLDPEQFTNADRASHKIAQGAQWLFLALSMTAVMLVGWQWLQ